MYFVIQHIFTPKQKEENPKEMQNMKYICNTEPKDIILDVTDVYDAAAQEERKKHREREYGGLEM
jgi:hypothetical protein